MTQPEQGGHRVDVSADVVVRPVPGAPAGEQIAVVALHGSGPEALGVAVNLDWLREFLYAAYWGHPPDDEWYRRYAGAENISGPSDLRELPLWPIVNRDAPEPALLRLAAGMGPDVPGAQRLSLSALREALSFDDEGETTVMQWPEIVSLIDGAPFRFPEAYFIGDMDTLVASEEIDRDPDWFRTFQGLPTTWIAGEPCELCGRFGGTVRYIIGPSRIVRCACGLESDRPRAVVPAQALDKFASDLADQRKATRSMERARQNAAILVNGLTQIAPGLLRAPLLDIGCASGETLHVLREEYGWPNEHLWGFELSPRSVEIATTNYGLNIVSEPLIETFDPGTFGVVMLFNTIEHLPHPRAVLRDVHSLLAADSALLISTVPNVNCLASWLFPEGFIAKNFPDGQHHHHFSPDTLLELCRQEGFTACRLDGEMRDPVMGNYRETAAWLAYSCGVPLETCRNERAMLDELRDLVRRAADRIATEFGEDYRFDFTGEDFANPVALVEFWRRVIWPSPYLSDEFDLWLRKSQPAL